MFSPLSACVPVGWFVNRITQKKKKKLNQSPQILKEGRVSPPRGDPPLNYGEDQDKGMDARFISYFVKHCKINNLIRELCMEPGEKICHIKGAGICE